MMMIGDVQPVLGSDDRGHRMRFRNASRSSGDSLSGAALDLDFEHSDGELGGIKRLDRRMLDF